MASSLNCIETIVLDSVSVESLTTIEYDNKSMLLSGTRNKKVHLIELSNASGEPSKPYKVYEGHRKDVTDVDYASNGDIILSASRDNMLRMFNLEDRSYIAVDTKTELYKVSINCDNNMIITASNENSICLWNIRGQLMKVWNVGTEHFHKSRITALKFVPKNPELFVSGSEDGTVKIWNADTGSHEATFFKGQFVDYEKAEHDKVKVEDFSYDCAVSSVDFSTDGSLFFYGSRDGKVYMNKLDTRENLSSISVSGRVTAIATSPCQPCVAIAVPNKVIVWNFYTDNPVGEYEFSVSRKEKYCYTLKFLENEVIAGLNDGTVARIEANK